MPSPAGARQTLSKIPVKIQEVIIGGVFWAKLELFLRKIRTLNSEIQSLGRAKRKGVGGKEFLPALAFRFQFFPPPPNFVPIKLAYHLYSNFLIFQSPFLSDFHETQTSSKYLLKCPSLRKDVYDLIYSSTS